MEVLSEILSRMGSDSFKYLSVLIYITSESHHRSVIKLITGKK